MKKTLKILLFIFLSLLIINFSFVVYCFIITKDSKLDKNKLINTTECITYYYSNGEKILDENEGKEITCIEKIPTHVKNAFISIEDKRFYSHKGIDIKGLFRATFNNIKSFSLKEGASTISQQLIKNTHLSNEKTFKRKITEIKLSLELEKEYSKDEILEKYLNTIYFGEGCYGITSASKHYFNKKVEELSINDGATLAGIIKSPSKYSISNNQSACTDRKNLVLKEMLNQNYVTQKEYEENIILPCASINYKNTQIRNNSFINLVKKELSPIIDSSPYSTDIKVYTTIDYNLQNLLEKNCESNHKKSCIILDSNNNIKAYYSNTKEEKRQLGSTLKPILCYAPAIEENVIYPATKMLDKKEDFNGYSPSNYNDKYYGYITIKEALEKSVNTIPVALLEKVGVENAVRYLKMMNFNIIEEDKTLALALGAVYNGKTLLEIASLYNVFQNEGDFFTPTILDKVVIDDVIKTKTSNKVKVFSSGTTSIINDMLYSASINGTSKKLSSLGFPIYAKTGTVGCKKGNTDAYSISYNKEYVLGVWEGNNDNEYLDNNITGATAPTLTAVDIWKNVYKNTTPPTAFELSDEIINLEIDKNLYDKENVLVLADKNAPARYKISFMFRKNNTPKLASDEFSNPKVKNAEISLINNRISIRLCVAKHLKFNIYRDNGTTKELVYDGDNVSEFIDDEIYPNIVYQYSIIPYYQNKNTIIYGNEVFLDKIKSPSINDGDEWWMIDD